MQRFRSTWIALIGGALLITLSVSAAFGAAPANTREATRGQTIAAFVHELVFGADEAPEEEAELEEEELDEEDAEALQDPADLDEQLEDEETEEADAHGECVSEVAQDPEAIGGVNENHGGAVSEAARVTCWETEEDPELADPEEDEEDLQEADAHGACVAAVAQDKTAVGGKNGNHGGAVSEAARETCPADAEEDEAALDEGDDELDEAAVESDKEAAKAEKNATREAARTDKGGGKPTWAGTGGNGGNANAGQAKANNGGGNGRGGGRP